MKQNKIINILYFVSGFCFLLTLSILFFPFCGDIKTLKMKPSKHMTQANLQYDSTLMNPNAVIVLCPGYNRTAKDFLPADEWRKFAQQNNLGLVYLAFASQKEDLSLGKKGYYYVDQESGDIFFDGIKKIYGKDLPILLYGYSGGAHFVSRLVEWKPERVIAWCAYSAGWWDEPKSNDGIAPPGIVACGTLDIRYRPSYSYFQQGRELNRPWLWVGIADYDHWMSPALEDFARNYFEAVLHNKEGIWLDIENNILLDSPPGNDGLQESAWLPDCLLFEKWLELTVVN